MIKKFLSIILIGLILLLKPPVIVDGCAPPWDWEIFISGDHFVIGQVIEVEDSEFLIAVADYFTSEVANDANLIGEVVSFSTSSIWQQDPINQGDYVVASFDGVNFCDATTGAIFHVTSLDYATLLVKDSIEPNRILFMLTDFVNHRGAYSYRETNTRIYRSHRQNSMEFSIIYNSTSLILGDIVAIDEGEIIMEISDYITSEDRSLTSEQLTLYWTFDSERRLFDDFNVGDAIAVNLELLSENTDMRARAIWEVDVFAVTHLDEEVQLRDVRGHQGVSALYTDLLQNRDIYEYRVIFERGSRNYTTVVRLVDGEWLVIYEQEVEEEDSENLVIELDLDQFTRPTPTYPGLPIALMTISIGSALGIAIIFLVVSKRKDLKNEK